MQNYNSKFKIALISIAVFGAGFLFALPANATQSCLEVDWATTTAGNWQLLQGPIFNETNFLPGNGVARLIRVTNNCQESHRIATEAINEIDSDNFASQLNLDINQGATDIFNDTLAQFFSQGETYLSDASAGGQNIYDFTITFNPSSGNEYQEKSLGFDILVGFEGTEEGGLPLPPPGGGTGGGGGGGGGGGLPEGLTIANETAQQVFATSVTISWTTNYLSTSQVIYGAAGEKHTLDLTDTAGTPSKYGYEHTTPEYDISPKMTTHSVTITGLTSGITYYYRAVSHASFAVSTEHSFTTLAITNEGAGQGSEEDGNEVSGGTTQGENIQPEQEAGGTGREDTAETGGLVAGTQTEENNNSGGATAENEEGKAVNFGNLLATVGDFVNLGNFWWISIILLIILILIVLFFLLKKKKKKEQNHPPVQ